MTSPETPASASPAPPPPGKPELALNLGDGATVAKALNGFLRYAAVGLTGPTHLDIATAYFDAEGYAQLAEALGRIDSVRLLLGAEPHPPAPRPRILGDGFNPVGTHEQQQLTQAVSELDENIRWGRDMLGFTPQTAGHVTHLLRWLESGKVQVRRLERQFLHGKAFLIGADGHGVIAGSSNFTRAGLTSNVELNLGNYSPGIVAQVQDFFNDLWDKAADYDLATIFKQEFELHSPHLIFLRMLWERYRDELESEEVPTADLSLTEFQEHGVERARKIMKAHHGVLIADEVGLGKTYIASALIREAASENRQRVLVVAPAALRDGMWSGFLKKQDFGRQSVVLVSYEELAAGNLSQEELDEFSLVVVDEAHYLRNPATRRAAVFHRLLDSHPRKNLVLLTATPINNSLDDLYHLLGYFLRYDTDLAEVGVRSLKQKFKEAQKLSPEELTPKDLFDVIDAVAVRRMRHFIQQHYPDSRIPTGRGGDGSGRDGETGDTAGASDTNGEVISFPKTNVLPVPYELGDVLPEGFFREFADALAPNDEQSQDDPGVLTLARYTPSEYLKPGAELPADHPEQYETRLAGLMRSLLLKRFESSPHAFANSCQKMAKANESFLEMLERGVVATKKMLADYIATDSDEATEAEQDDDLLEDAESAASNYDLESLRADVQQDIRLLRSFETEARKVTRETDPTLAKVAKELATILSDAERLGKDEQDIRNKRKVLIFSYYSDTVDWIYDYLQGVAAKPGSPLGDYHNRIAKITGSDNASQKSKVLLGFAPLTAGSGKEVDLYDIVVTTDVLAEGVNLQQASHIINYDLPWNPMRLVQRHGRIDRIGSLHTEVFIRCVLPDSKLDDLLRLEERLRFKLKQAASTVGTPQTLPFQDREEVIFADSDPNPTDEIRRLSKGDATLLEQGGPAVAALSGEQFRQELRKALSDAETRQQIKQLPWRSGSAMEVSSSEVSLKKGESGFVFCLRIGDRSTPQFCFVKAGEKEVKAGETGDDGEGGRRAKKFIKVITTDTLECLHLARPPSGAGDGSRDSWDTPAIPQDLDEDGIIFEAWEAACEYVLADWNKNADKAEAEPKIEKVLRDAASLLRENPPPNSTQEDIDKAVDAIQAPLADRHTKAFRKLLKTHKDNPQNCAQAILAEVQQMGLKRYTPPPPNPQITKKDIHLICHQTLTPK